MDYLRTQLERQEDKRYKPYDDATGKELRVGDIIKGKITVGIGWNMSDVALPDEIIDMMYEISIKRADNGLKIHLPWVFNLDEVRRDVIRNMCFNMGINRLLKFYDLSDPSGCTLGDVQKGDYKSAASRLRKSLWYKQVPVRATELINQLETGIRG